jgi:hypothetical protein
MSTLEGPRTDVGDAVLAAVETRPLEVLLPRSRGLLVKAAGAFPRFGALLAPVLARVGRFRQARDDARKRNARPVY